MDFEKLNKLHLQNKKNIKKVFVIFPICFIGFAIGAIMHNLLVSVIFFLIMVIASVFILRNKHDIGGELLNQYILPILKDSFENFKYDDCGGLDLELIKYLDFIRTLGCGIKSEYSMEGYYKNVYFLEGGVECTKNVRSNGDVHTDTTFSGRVIVFDLSLFKGDGVIDVVCRKPLRYKFITDNTKVKFDHEISEYYDIYVSDDCLKLKENVMNYFTILAKNYSYCDFYFRITSDKLYMVIDNIDCYKFDVDKLEVISKESIDELIKKECAFITNTISNIID